MTDSTPLYIMSSTPRRRGRPPLAQGESRARANYSGQPRKRGRPPKSVSMARASASVPWSASTPVSFASREPSVASDDDITARLQTPPPAPIAPLPAALRGTPSDIPALVFQCSGCMTIVGDSYAWVMAHKELSLIVLAQATDKVAVPDDLVACQEELCRGSTYLRLCCASCGRELGRKFQSTPPALDALRGAFSFYVDAVTVYQLGSTHAGGQPSTVPARQSPEADGKMRDLIMVLGERLVRVERYLGLLDEAPRSSTPRR